MSRFGQGWWPSIVRVVVGAYWLFFASQKWTGVEWMKPLMRAAAAANPIPGLHQILSLEVAPNWEPFAIAQAAGETAVGVLLVVGLGTRWAALAGILLALNLCLTVAPLTADGFRWMYVLALLVNVDVAVKGPGRLALERLALVPGWRVGGAR